MEADVLSRKENSKFGRRVQAVMQGRRTHVAKYLVMRPTRSSRGNTKPNGPAVARGNATSESESERNKNSKDEVTRWRSRRADS